MADKKLLRLMNQELDGTNSVQDSRRLAEILSADAEARTKFEELRATLAVLRRAEAEAPPSGLKAAILERIEAGAETPASRTASAPRRGWMARFAEAPAAMKFRYALFFALGFSLGIVLLLLFKNRPAEIGLDSRQLVGTLTGENGAAPAEQFRFDAAGASGEVAVRYGQGLIVAEVRLRSSREVELAFDFDPQRLSVAVFERGTREPDSAKIAPDGVTIDATGVRTYTIAFALKPGSGGGLRFRASAAGLPFFEKDIRLPSGTAP